MLKIYMMIFIVGLIGSIGYGAYATWNHMQAKIEILTANNAKLEGAVQTQKDTIGALESDIQAVNNELKCQPPFSNTSIHFCVCCTRKSQHLQTTFRQTK